jgi:hypothetical protein
VISITMHTIANAYPNSKIQNAACTWDIDKNDLAENLRDIFAFCQYKFMNLDFLKLHINSCFYYVIYDIINIFQFKA